MKIARHWYQVKEGKVIDWSGKPGNSSPALEKYLTRCESGQILEQLVQGVLQAPSSKPT